MAVSPEILGMNARNFQYVTRHNSRAAKRAADSKLRTKQLFKERGINTSRLLAVFRTRKDIKEFDWTTLPSEGFVIKPARGYGGSGIIVLRKWDGEQGWTASGEEYTAAELEPHLLDILDGNYSLNALRDRAFIEELVFSPPLMKKLSPHGLPDIRVIVFNKTPIMAMMRLPTEFSHGTANLHQGAVGCGIAMRTGITTGGVVHNRPVQFIPGTRTKVHGIKIPDWNDILLLAVRAHDAVGLGYSGIDIVLDKKRGPLVLEVNARPGLAIQAANRASLRSRLERVEGLKVTTAERGVEIAKSLFTEGLHARIPASEPAVLGVIEDVTFTVDGKSLVVPAKIDTGARRSSLDYDLVDELGLEHMNKQVFVRAASGQQMRPLVKTSFLLGGKRISSEASVAARSHMRYRLIIGRKDLKGFLVDPTKFPQKKVVPPPTEQDAQKQKREDMTDQESFDAALEE